MNEKKVYESKNSYEEISEKKTSKLGYILLTIMVCFVIGVGETIFTDLSEIPEEPYAPSYCLSNLINTDEVSNITYFDCPDYTGYEALDIEFELDSQLENARPRLEKLVNLNAQISDLKYEISNNEKEIKELSSDYDLSLQEKIANEESILEKDTIKADIVDTKELSSQNETELNNLIAERDQLAEELTPVIQEIKKTYENANDKYEALVAWYKFKVFLLTLIFILPFFAISTKYYLQHKRKNSPYTIIFTATTTAFSLLFLQVMGTFLYDILPKAWFAKIFKFLLDIPLLSYIIYYGSVLLIIGIFGGIVYYIQKRVYDPIKVAVRRLKDQKCPKCSFTLDSSHNFCPDCGLQLKEQCSHCKKLKIRYLAHCPHCGTNEKNIKNK